MNDICVGYLKQGFSQFFCADKNLCPSGNNWYFYMHREELCCLYNEESFCFGDEKIVASVLLFCRTNVPAVQGVRTPCCALFWIHIYTRDFVPGGARGVLSKLNSPSRVEYADSLLLVCDVRNKLSESWDCGSSSFHNCNGKRWLTVQSPDIR